MEEKGAGPDQFALGFQKVSERLETLPQAIQELAAREGRGLPQAIDGLGSGCPSSAANRKEPCRGTPITVKGPSHIGDSLFLPSRD